MARVWGLGKGTFGLAALGMACATVAMAGIFGKVAWAPAMNGVVVKDGRPVPDARVKRIVRGPGGQEAFDLVTGSDGRFSFPAVDGKRGLPLTTFGSGEEVEITVAGTSYLGWVDSESRIVDAGSLPALDLACELADADRSDPLKVLCRKR